LSTVTDWPMFIITAIYVGATIAIWLANYKSVRMTEKQLDESRAQFEESKRLECMPFLQLEIPSEQERPLFEIILDLCDRDITDSLYKIVRLKNLGNGSATNLNYVWKSNRLSNPLYDYPPINAIMNGDSYYFQLTFNIDDAFEDNTSGVLIWRYEDLLGNSYDQKVSFIFDNGDLVRCENNTPQYFGVIGYTLADNSVNAEAGAEDKSKI